MKNSNYIPVEGHPELVRDKNSQAILNIDAQALKAFKAKREQQRKIHNMVNEFNILKNDVQDIKSLLKNLLDKLPQN